MNNWRYTKLALSIMVIFINISVMIALFNKDYTIIPATVLLSIPGYIYGLLFDCLYELFKRK